MIGAFLKSSNQGKQFKEVRWRTIFFLIIWNFQLMIHNNDKWKFWKVIRHFVNNSGSIPPIIDPDDKAQNGFKTLDSEQAEILNKYFIVSSAQQTHRDNVVRPHRRRHTFCFRSITFDGMHWFQSKSEEVYITVKHRSSSIFGNHPPKFDLVMAFFRLSFLLLG